MDTSRYGRGEMHLSAELEEGDVVVYQTGSWYVDGVLVGDEPIDFAFAQIETIQLVWTHNCEHGVLRGLALQRKGDDQLSRTEYEQVEFGPEQLIGRIQVDWQDDPSERQATCSATVPLDGSAWPTDETD